ncbi:MAG: hypothetical protein ABI744_04160 [Chloroflexota bacterium]
MIALVIAAVALAVALVLLAGSPAEEHLLGPFRWNGTGAEVA